MTLHSLTKPMARDESYAQRRELFKNIWKTALTINPNDANILNKPKIIKTLRMDEIDRCPVGKTKKERIKNLRHVCNKILDFCDKQDADDLHYKKLSQDVSATNKEHVEKSNLVTKDKPTKPPKPKKITNMFLANTELTMALQKESKTILPILTHHKRPPVTTRVAQKRVNPSAEVESTSTKKGGFAAAGNAAPSHKRKIIKKKFKKKKTSTTT